MDSITTYHGATIQHGDHSQRIYLMKLGSADPKTLPAELLELAREKNYSKIFCKLPASQATSLLSAGYQREAVIPAYYKGQEDAVLLGLFLQEERAQESHPLEVEAALELAQQRALHLVMQKGDTRRAPITPMTPDLKLVSCEPEDCEEMSEVYKVVFASYPFPIHNPDYLRETMESHIHYMGVRHEGKLIAIASAEMDLEAKAVEMTDFATLPDWRGNSLARHLLWVLEAEMRKRGMITTYTIARAVSPGMNITFAQEGYAYSGRLVSNTQISGGIESMNIWHKPL